MTNEYEDRIHAVVQYIKDNRFRKLTLDELAERSHFSKYHFSRIFASIVGVTPIAFVTQVRLQAAVHYLAESSRTILEISQLCGFESVAAFNSAFKKHYQRTPSEVRAMLRQNRNFLSILSKKQQEIPNPLGYDVDNRSNFLRRIWKMNIQVKELPEYEVAYVRHVGSYLDTHLAWRKLGIWASEKGLSPMNQHFIGISLDDPDMTDEDACRYDACVTIPEDFQKDDHGEVQYKKLPGGLYASYSFYDTVDKLAIAYLSLFGQWLPNSEYEADDRPCLEFSMNDPSKDKEGKCKVDLCIPIKKRA